MRNPVNDVYDQFRTARLNVKYLGIQINRLRSWNFWIELSLAITASSNVAGIIVLQCDIGQIFWQILISITAILAVIKPLLKLASKIQKKEELLVGYSSIFFDLERLILTINQKQFYNDKLKERFLQILDKKQKLMVITSETKEDKKLNLKCYNEVNQEYPPDYFPELKEENHV